MRPTVAILRSRIQALPQEAIEYVNRRAPVVIAHLFRDEPPVIQFQHWAVTADAAKLIRATQLLSAEGGRVVGGRSRGGGKRSGLRLEPVIMDEARGTGTDRHRGGRPTSGRQTLVMHLAIDWLRATGKAPKPGRSDRTGFGDLVHNVFQWLGLPEPAHTLRRYWAEVKGRKAREPPEDSLRRHGEEL